MKFNFSAAVSQYSVSFGIICVSGTQSVHSKLKGSQQGTFVLYRKKDSITPNGIDDISKSILTVTYRTIIAIIAQVDSIRHIGLYGIPAIAFCNRPISLFLSELAYVCVICCVHRM